MASTDDRSARAHAALQALRAELEALLDTTNEAAKPVDLDTPIGRLSRIDALQQQKMLEAHRDRARVRLRQTLAALAAVRDGTWGECRRCGDDIDERRLAARPESPLCMPCTEAIEQGRT